MTSSQSEKCSATSATRAKLDERNCGLIDVDNVWNFLGVYGKYQIFHTVLITFGKLAFGTAVLSTVFVGKDVKFECVMDNSTLPFIPANASVLNTGCHVQVLGNNSEIIWEEECQKRDYGHVHTSFLSEWDLVCDREALGQLPQMMVMVGMATGATCLPTLGDRFGRKLLMSVCQMCMCLAMLGISFAPTFEVFAVLSFLSGAFNQGFVIPTTTLLFELYPTDIRGHMGFYSAVLWVIACLLLVPFAYAMENMSWRLLQLAYAMIPSTIVFYVWYFDESVRWLLANAKVERAEKTLKRACKMNNKSYEELLEAILKKSPQSNHGDDTEQVELLSPVDAADREKNQSERETKPSLIDVWRNPLMRKMMLILCYTWMTSALTYYGLILLSTSLAGDPYVNFCLGTVAELVSVFFMLFSIQRFGRKPTVIGLMVTASGSLVSAAVVATFAPQGSGYLILQMAFTFIGKFAISGSFSTIWVYTPEIYPTNLRNFGIGISAACARIGAIATPFFKLLAREATWAPGVLFSLMCIIAAFLMNFIPETRRREMPQSIEEIEGWFRERSKKREKKIKDTSFVMPTNGFGNC